VIPAVIVLAAAIWAVVQAGAFLGALLLRRRGRIGNVNVVFTDVEEPESNVRIIHPVIYNWEIEE
jgi:hypothetical protein